MINFKLHSFSYVIKPLLVTDWLLSRQYVNELVIQIYIMAPVCFSENRFKGFKERLFQRGGRI